VSCSDGTVAELPDPAELERLGLYDPAAPDAEERLRLVTRVFELGATVAEAIFAARLDALGPLTLDLTMRPAGATCELDEFAADAGLDRLLVRRLWLALGLPDSGPIRLRVTPDAAGALRVVAAMTTILGEEPVFALARVVGSSMARTAEALSDTFRVAIEVPQRAGGTPYSQVVEEYSARARDLLPAFFEAIKAIFRRHLVLVSYQQWSTDEQRAAVTRELTVGFADVVGSTGTTRDLTVRELADVVRRFEEQAWSVVMRAGGRVVKVIGDEVMFVVAGPDRACEAALELVERLDLPARAGLAHGPLVGLYGDYYGRTVNLAARLVDAAAPSSVVVSRAVQAAAGARFRFEPLGELQLKGFADPVPAYTVDRA